MAKVDLIPAMRLSRASLPSPLMLMDSAGTLGSHLPAPEHWGLSHKYPLPRLNLNLASLASRRGPHWPLETPRAAQLLIPDVPGQL